MCVCVITPSQPGHLGRQGRAALCAAGDCMEKAVPVTQWRSLEVGSLSCCEARSIWLVIADIYVCTSISDHPQVQDVKPNLLILVLLCSIFLDKSACGCPILCVCPSISEVVLTTHTTDQVSFSLYARICGDPRVANKSTSEPTACLVDPLLLGETAVISNI
ncbi:hypothetical protein BR93DRAFT_329266 [Coniochaeta sp. PMI_546]|nr:hypothetical protein BR93DRAFT_329266 [Coniochaeta sp. PMI_546]